MEYRRSLVNGGQYFFTVVTYKREAVLTQSDNIDILRQAFRTTQKRHPFTIDAIVVLPDHVHTIWTMPEGDYDYSTRWRLIKSTFTRECEKTHNHKRNSSRERKKEQTIWQRRFWEHMIRDDGDFEAHCDYIHYNPVKHGLVEAPGDWKYSSFHRYVKNGFYDGGWGSDKSIEFEAGIGSE